MVAQAFDLANWWRDTLSACSTLPADRTEPLVVLCPHDQAVAQLLHHWTELHPNDPPPIAFPSWQTLPYEHASPTPSITAERLRTLATLTHAHTAPPVVITSLPAWLLCCPPPDYLARHSHLLHVGDTVVKTDFERQLTKLGYQRTDLVREPGEFAVRGGCVDFYPPLASWPVRVEWDDNTVDALRTFDPSSQRSRTPMHDLTYLPPREYATDADAVDAFKARWRDQFAGNPNACRLYHSRTPEVTVQGMEYFLPCCHDHVGFLSDFLGAHWLSIAAPSLASGMQAYRDQMHQRFEALRHQADWPLLAPDQLLLDPARAAASLGQHNLAKTSSLPPHGWSGWTSTLTDQPVVLCGQGHLQQQELVDRCRQEGLTAQVMPSFPVNNPAPLTVCTATFPYGFWEARHQRWVLTERELFDRPPHERFNTTSTPFHTAAIATPSDATQLDVSTLEVGEPVVHQEHGIGAYQGLTTLTLHGHDDDMVMLTYAGGDKIYVPMDQLHQLSRYAWSDDDAPALTQLGHQQWSKAKRQAREAIADTAASLLAIQAERSRATGQAWDRPEGYQDFCDAFPFELTHDQAQAVDATLEDLKAPHPMDRLICGDVGFGKTEVALRAAFVVASQGGQVAMLVPTTLLANQHVKTFTERFAPWPLRVVNLSRHNTHDAREGILQGLACGTIDVVVGTHALLQPSVRFKHLGLLIVDEEHRFGVKHKEAIKALRASVDVLTLTATPIPRTLQQALSNLRDLSIIATPPQQRLPVKTFVHTFEAPLAQEALAREWDRGGQTYVLCNNLKRIENEAATLREWLPQARVEVAHGQMHHARIQATMQAFYRGDIDVLVSSTIVESGIDVPNANTLLVLRADRLGLSQLHQLRGRVGRSNRQAYAYFFTPDPSYLTKDAQARLEAISAHTEIGAGFQLAMQDLDIRGAGELLGSDQSGHIHRVGQGLYMTWVQEATTLLAHGSTLQAFLDDVPAADQQVQTDVPARFPEAYLPDVSLRLRGYSELNRCQTLDAIDHLAAGYVDRFGPLPDAAQALFLKARCRLVAQACGMERVVLDGATATLQVGAQAQCNRACLIGWLQANPPVATMVGADTVCCDLSDTPSGVERLKRLLKLLSALAKPAP